MAEASFESGLVECTLMCWVKAAANTAATEPELSGTTATPAELYKAERNNRLARHFQVTKPVISGFVTALQCAALVAFGIFINQLLELFLSSSA